MTDDQKLIGWLAGIFEGEGNINIRPNGHQVTIAVGMCDEDVVKKLHQISNCGAVYGPFVKKNPKHKPIWKWYVSYRDDVALLLNLMLPFFGERRKKRAEEALYVISTMRPRLRNNSLEIRHGTSWGYQLETSRNLQHCQLCKDAIALRQRLYRSRRLVANV